MKKMALFGICVLSLFAVSPSSKAQSLNPHLNGSTFVVDASNPTDQLKRCSITYTLSYSQYGQNGSQQYSRQFNLAPHFNGPALIHQTSYSASSLKFSVDQMGCA